MILEGLYDRGYLIYYKEGDISLQRTPLTYYRSIDDKYHVVREEETLLSIAQIYYNSQYPWYFIADINIIEDIFDLEIGSVLLIPDLNLIYGGYA